MYIKNDTIHFKSVDSIFYKECSGFKNNTVRILMNKELEIFNLNKHHITKIKLSLNKDKFFIRKLSDITLIQVKGWIIAIFSWKV